VRPSKLLKLTGFSVFLLTCFLFFFFWKKESSVKSKSLGMTGRKESLSYSFSYTDYIVSVDASRTNGGLDGLKLLNAKFRLANLENTYTYLEGVAKRALLKKSSVVLKDFSGKACNKTAFM